MASQRQPAAAETTWEARDPARPALYNLAERLGEVEALDPLAEKLGGATRRLLPAGPVKDALSGTWLGHSLHPLLTDVPIGTWTSATILDLIGGRSAGAAAERLIAIGIGAAVPTAASGLSDWADSTKLDDTIRRGGAVHAMANTAALALYTASLAARRAGKRRRGVLLGLGGAGALAVGGHLGGHLSYAKGLGVDHTTFHRAPREWTRVLEADELGDDQVRFVEVEGAPLLLSRRDGRVSALSNRCSHRGAPLHEGEIAEGCVTCPWHGSVFRLDDGSVVRGPAAFPQPTYDVRVADGAIAVRAS